MIEVDRRAELLARGAAEWRDRTSPVRAEARAALSDSGWSLDVIELALDNVLFDLDANRASVISRAHASAAPRPVLVILPGNIIGPAVASAYCAAAAGASAILKSPGVERALAPVVARQLDRLGPPLAGSVDARYWKGGDPLLEADVFSRVRRIVVFGDDATVDAVRERAPGVDIVSYGDSFSIGFVPLSAPLGDACEDAALCVALFDQRGCMSPQTIYVEGDEGRALQFARLLAGSLVRLAEEMPRAAPEPNEAALAADLVRRLRVTALAPKTHGLDTVMVGAMSNKDGPPDFIVAVLPFAAPVRAGFGRIVTVMPCSGSEAVSDAVAEYGERIDTIGVATASGAALEIPAVFRRTIARRVCELGAMQRPPFGYRPAIEDFS